MRKWSAYADHPAVLSCEHTAGFSAAAAAPERPNLVYVFADQLRYQSCGYAGDEFARTAEHRQAGGAGL